MTPAQVAAYEAKRARERLQVQRFTHRYESACFWLESNFNSLTHWRRFVEGVEEIILHFRHEEQALSPFDGSAFMRELCAEDPALWADPIQAATPQTEEVPHP